MNPEQTQDILAEVHQGVSDTARRGSGVFVKTPNAAPPVLAEGALPVADTGHVHVRLDRSTMGSLQGPKADANVVGSPIHAVASNPVSQVPTYAERIEGIRYAIGGQRIHAQLDADENPVIKFPQTGEQPETFVSPSAPEHLASLLMSHGKTVTSSEGHEDHPVEGAVSAGIAAASTTHDMQARIAAFRTRRGMDVFPSDLTQKQKDSSASRYKGFTRTYTSDGSSLLDAVSTGKENNGVSVSEAARTKARDAYLAWYRTPVNSTSKRVVTSSTMPTDNELKKISAMRDGLSDNKFEYVIDDNFGVMRKFSLNKRLFFEPIVPGKISSESSSAASYDNHSGVLFNGDIKQPEDTLQKWLNNRSHRLSDDGKTILEAHQESVRSLLDKNTENPEKMIGDRPEVTEPTATPSRTEGIHGQQGASASMLSKKEKGEDSEDERTLGESQIRDATQTANQKLQEILTRIARESESSSTLAFDPSEMESILRDIAQIGEIPIPQRQKAEQKAREILEKQALRKKLSATTSLRIDDLVSPLYTEQGLSFPGKMLLDMTTHAFLGKEDAGEIADEGLHTLARVARVEASKYQIDANFSGQSGILDAVENRLDPINMQTELAFAQAIIKNLTKSMATALQKYDKEATAGQAAGKVLTIKKTPSFDAVLKLHKLRIFELLGVTQSDEKKSAATPGVDVSNVKRHQLLYGSDVIQPAPGSTAAPTKRIQKTFFYHLRPDQLSCSDEILTKEEMIDFNSEIDEAYKNYANAQRNATSARKPGAEPDESINKKREEISRIVRNTFVLKNNEKAAIDSILERADPYIMSIRQCLPDMLFQEWRNCIKNADWQRANDIMKSGIAILQKDETGDIEQESRIAALEYGQKQLLKDVSQYVLKKPNRWPSESTGLFVRSAQSPTDPTKGTVIADENALALFRKARRNSLIIKTDLWETDSLDNPDQYALAAFVDKYPHLLIPESSWADGFTEKEIADKKDAIIKKTSAKILAPSRTEYTKMAKDIVARMRMLIDHEYASQEDRPPLGSPVSDDKGENGEQPPWHDASWFERYAVPGATYSPTNQTFQESGKFPIGVDGSFVTRTVLPEKVAGLTSTAKKIWTPKERTEGDKPAISKKGNRIYHITERDQVGFDPAKSLLSARASADDASDFIIPVQIPIELDADKLQGYYPNPAWSGLTKKSSQIDSAYAASILSTARSITDDRNYNPNPVLRATSAETSTAIDASAKKLQELVREYLSKNAGVDDIWERARGNRGSATNEQNKTESLIKKIVAFLNVNNEFIASVATDKDDIDEIEAIIQNLNIPLRIAKDEDEKTRNIRWEMDNTTPAFFYKDYEINEEDLVSWIQAKQDLLKKYMPSNDGENTGQSISLSSSAQLIADAQKRIELITELTKKPELIETIKQQVLGVRDDIQEAESLAAMRPPEIVSAKTTTQSLSDILDSCKREKVTPYTQHSSLYPDQMRGPAGPLAFFVLGDNKAIESHNMIHIASDPLSVRYNPSATFNEAGEAISEIERVLLPKSGESLIPTANFQAMTRSEHRLAHVKSMIQEMKNIKLASAGERNPLFDITQELNKSLSTKLDAKHFDSPGWETRFIEALDEYCAKNEIFMFTPADPEYPKNLANIPGSWQSNGERSRLSHIPSMLFVKGNLSIPQEAQEKAVACIGTTKITMSDPVDRDIVQKTKSTVRNLAKNGWVIVSGMAEGIDSICHREALSMNAPTIGILGCGFGSSTLNQSQKAIYDEMTSPSANSMIITEYLPGMKDYDNSRSASIQQKIKRNRLQSGFSLATIMFSSSARRGWIKENSEEYGLQADEDGILADERQEDSGSMTTLRHSVYQRRKTFVLSPNFTTEDRRQPYNDQHLASGKMTGNIEANMLMGARYFDSSEGLLAPLGEIYKNRNDVQSSRGSYADNAMRILSNLGMVKASNQTQEDFVAEAREEIMRKVSQKDDDMLMALRAIADSYNPDGSKKSLIIHAPDENDASLKQMTMARALGIPMVVIPSRVMYSRTEMPDEYDSASNLTRINSLDDWAPLKPESQHSATELIQLAMFGETMEFGSAEAAYQASLYKTRDEAAEIAKLSTRQNGLSLIRNKVSVDKKSNKQKILTPDQKIQYMYRILKSKFQNKNFADILAKTGKAYIVHQSTDSFWGVLGKSPGISRDSQEVNGRVGLGKNIIGKLLMHIRDQGVNQDQLSSDDSKEFLDQEENCQIPWNKALPLLGMFPEDVSSESAAKMPPLTQPLRVGITGSRKGLTRANIIAALEGSLAVNKGLENNIDSWELSPFEEQFNLRQYSRTYIEAENKITPAAIIHGGAEGVDQEVDTHIRSNKESLFPQVFDENNIISIPFDDISSDDKKFNDPTAGFRRNTKIVANSDILVAIWDGTSRGTIHAVMTALRQGKPVHLWSPDGNGGMKLQEIYPSKTGNMTVMSLSDPSPKEDSALAVAQDTVPNYVRSQSLNLAEKLRTETFTLGISHDSPYMRGIRSDLINSAKPKAVTVLHGGEKPGEMLRGHYLGDARLSEGLVHKGTTNYSYRDLPADSPDSWESLSGLELKSSIQKARESKSLRAARETAMIDLAVGGAKDQSPELAGLNALTLALAPAQTLDDRKYVSVSAVNVNVADRSWVNRYNASNPMTFSPNSDFGQRMSKKTLGRSLVVRNTLFPDMFARVSISYASNEIGKRKNFNSVDSKFHVTLFHTTTTPGGASDPVMVGSIVYQIPSSPLITNLSRSRTESGKGFWGEGYMNYQKILSLFASDIASNLLASHQSLAIHQELLRNPKMLASVLQIQKELAELANKSRLTKEEKTRKETLKSQLSNLSSLSTIGIPLTIPPQTDPLSVLRSRQQDTGSSHVHPFSPLTAVVPSMRQHVSAPVASQFTTGGVAARNLSTFSDPIEITVDQINKYIDIVRERTTTTGAREVWPPIPTVQSVENPRTNFPTNPNVRYQASHMSRGNSAISGILMMWKAYGGEAKSAASHHITHDRFRGPYGEGGLNNIPANETWLRDTLYPSGKNRVMNINILAILYGSLLWNKNSNGQPFAEDANPESEILTNILQTHSQSTNALISNSVANLFQNNKIFTGLTNIKGVRASPSDVQQESIFHANMSDSQLFEDIESVSIISPKIPNLNQTFTTLNNLILGRLGATKRLLNGNYGRDNAEAALSLPTRWAMLRDNMFWMSRSTNFSDELISLFPREISTGIKNAKKVLGTTYGSSSLPVVALLSYLAVTPSSAQQLDKTLVEKILYSLETKTSSGIQALQQSISDAKNRFAFLESVRHDGDTSLIKMMPIPSTGGMQSSPLATTVKKSLRIPNNTTLLAQPAYLSAAFDMMASIDISYAATPKKIGFESTIAKLSKTNGGEKVWGRGSTDTKFVFIPGSVWQTTLFPFHAMVDTAGSSIVPQTLNANAYALVSSRHAEINKIFFEITGGTTVDAAKITQDTLFSKEQLTAAPDTSASHYVYLGTPLGTDIAGGMIVDQGKMIKYQRAVAMAIGHAANIKGATRISTNNSIVLPSDSAEFESLQNRNKDKFEEIAIKAISDGEQGSISDVEELRNRQIRALVWARIYIDSLHNAKRSFESQEIAAPNPYLILAPSKDVLFGATDSEYDAIFNACSSIQRRAYSDASIDISSQALTFGSAPKLATAPTLPAEIPKTINIEELHNLQVSIYNADKLIDQANRALIDNISPTAKEAYTKQKQDNELDRRNFIEALRSRILDGVSDGQKTAMKEKVETYGEIEEKISAVNQEIASDEMQKAKKAHDAIIELTKIHNGESKTVKAEDDKFFTGISLPKKALIINLSDPDKIESSLYHMGLAESFVKNSRRAIKKYKITLDDMKKNPLAVIPALKLQNALATSDGIPIDVSYGSWIAAVPERSYQDDTVSLRMYVSLLEVATNRQDQINKLMRTALGDGSEIRQSYIDDYLLREGSLKQLLIEKNEFIDKLNDLEKRFLLNPKKSEVESSVLPHVDTITAASWRKARISSVDTQARIDLAEKSKDSRFFTVTHDMIDMMKLHHDPTGALDARIRGEMFSWGSTLFEYLEKNNSKDLFCFDGKLKKFAILPNLSLQEERKAIRKLERSRNSAKTELIQASTQKIADEMKKIDDANEIGNVIDSAFQAFRKEAIEAHTSIRRSRMEYRLSLPMSFWKNQMINVEIPRKIQIVSESQIPPVFVTKQNWPQLSNDTQFPPLKSDAFLQWAAQITQTTDFNMQIQWFKNAGFAKSFEIVYHSPKTPPTAPRPRRSQLQKSRAIVFSTRGILFDRKGTRHDDN